MTLTETGRPFALGDGSGPSRICIDRIVAFNGRYLVSGWIHGCDLVSCAPDGEADPSQAILKFPRPDVAKGFNFEESSVSGFLFCCQAQRRVDVLVKVRHEVQDSRFEINVTLATEITYPVALELMRDYRIHAAHLHRAFSGSPDWLRALAKAAPEFAQAGYAKGHIEISRGIPEVGGLVVGWAIPQNMAEIFTISESGAMTSLEDAARWNRADIVETFSGTYGNDSQFAGFLVAQQAPLGMGEHLYLLALEGDSIVRLGESEWTSAPKDPLSFARWAFGYHTPMGRFYKRLSLHDGPIIAKLIASQRNEMKNIPYEIISFGSQIERPECSIIIPLYRRFDFMHNQLLEMAVDNFIREKCEIIYVLDDPLLDDSLRSAAPVFLESYGIPFKLVIGNVNRGFAGANNVGAQVANAPLFLLLNSDVIPVATGWLENLMHHLLASSNTAIVGSRLLFANGAIQHDGMNFFWEPSWNCHLNKHPNSGMNPLSLQENEFTTRTAVTAACMLVRKQDYEDAGGLDDEFLVGDFEDSDFCLKLKSKGREIICVHHNALTHLERQSFSSLGAHDFRDKVARYNAWRHEGKWGDLIRTLSNSNKGN